MTPPPPCGFPSMGHNSGPSLQSLAPWGGKGQGLGQGGRRQEYCPSTDPARVSRPYLNLDPATSFFPKRALDLDTYPGSMSGKHEMGCMKLPPVGSSSPPPAGQICGNHPRDDSCRVPRLPPVTTNFGCPKAECCGSEPAAHCVDRIPHVRKAENYEPNTAPFDGCSSYRTHFKGSYVAPSSSYKPETTVGFTDSPFEGCSTYRDTFRWKISDTERYRKEKEEYIPTTAPFQGSSTYRQDFQPVFAAPSRSFKPGQTVDDFTTARFDGVSSYRTEFVPYCPVERNYARGVSVKPTEGSGSGFACSPFEACSTYRMDFVPKSSRKPLSNKPQDKAGFSSAAFCGRSTYRNDYIPFYYRNNCQEQNLSNECFMPTPRGCY